MVASPIFIVGTERSGSNLLRLILNSHSRIVVPHPPHVVRYFEPLERSYGDLATDDRFGRLVDDILLLVRLHIYPWDVPIDRDRIVRSATPRTAFGVVIELYDQYREAVGKARWGCKSTFMVHHGDKIVRRFPEARLIFLVRDPRDVAASSKRSIFSTYSPYNTACLWRDQQLCGLELLERLPKSNVLCLRYESLVAHPERSVPEVCAFLGEAFEEQMLRFFDTEEARKSARLSESWSNTDRPILNRNADKYRNELSDDEVRLVESVTEIAMDKLGYVATHSSDELRALEVTSPMRVRFWLDELTLKLCAELRSLRHDKNASRRWARGFFLSYLGMRRAIPFGSSTSGRSVQRVEQH